VIHERVIAAAKRLVYYTDKSIKEVADELGFEDLAHFSKFFKNVTTKSPSELRNNQILKN
jgi:AraC-like DNA-binding protein